MIETDLTLPDGRALRAYDTGGDGLPVFWHHGTPNIGAPPRPLFAEGIRWVSFDRPGYGGSTAVPERDVASVAECAAAVADAFGIERFAVMGHSGGGPHALACGALLPERVLGVVGISGLAPFDAEGLDWYAGMNPSGADGLRAAVEGRAAKEKFEAAGAYDSEMFTEADHAALAGDWAWVGEVVGPALAAGTSALIDDDLAFVGPWGFDPAQVTAPVLLVHGEDDRVVPHSHSAWLAKRCPAAEFWSSPGDGHVSVLRRAAEARDWLTRL
ncbi:alpha/beta fold hydrolase [Amycolatopsis sp. NPDC059657]|uniref:alpha/beta fold hydrolase n=1 Tax=Amycolatopsis sp. NPDC059657 TaxID=3346899 RepID=UPI00366C18BE